MGDVSQNVEQAAAAKKTDEQTHPAYNARRIHDSLNINRKHCVYPLTITIIIIINLIEVKWHVCALASMHRRQYDALQSTYIERENMSNTNN